MKALWKAFFVTMTLAIPFGIAGAQAGQAQDIQGNPPFAGGKKMTTEEALKAAPGADPTLAPFEKAFKAADAKLKKSPKDAKAKKAYVDAAFKYGHAALERGQVSPRIMYRASLALYRKALAVDPKHKPSLAEKKVIEDIYATMPGGIPK